MKRISWLLIVPLVLAVASVPAACVENRQYEYQPGSGGSSNSSSSTGGMGGASNSSSGSMSSSSTGGMAGAGGDGGMGGMPECKKLDDCISTECKKALDCVAGNCIWQNAADGDPNISQIYGDCKDRVCDGNGNVKTVDGDPVKDIYDWKNPCYINACAVDPDMAKMPNDNAVCKKPWDMMDGYCLDYKCVECGIDTDCMMGEKCLGGRCIPESCADMGMSTGETDIDCGGPDCLPCTTNQNCMADTDCESGLCDTMVTGRCLAPSCTDGLRNGDETDMDCGGSCSTATPPAPCAVMKICLFPADCESGVCEHGLCALPTCLDFTKNQGEEGIDCGGPCPLKCATMMP